MLERLTLWDFVIPIVALVFVGLFIGALRREGLL